MGEPPPGSPREEAERLVAAAVVTASLATRGWLARAGHGATDAAECGVCPFCRALAAVRDPDPVLVERVARGAGDVAEGVSGLLRAVGDLLRPADPAASPADPADPAAAAEDPAAAAEDVPDEAEDVADQAEDPADGRPEGESGIPRQVPPPPGAGVQPVVREGDRRTPLVTDNLDTAS